MKKSSLTTLGFVILAGSFLLTANTFATEDYDTKKYGPKSPIIMEHPVNVRFDHRVHTDDIGLECGSCHDSLFVMQRGITPKKDQTMSALAKGKSCGACHDGETAFASNTRCDACHIKSKGMESPSDPHPHGDTVKAH